MKPEDFIATQQRGARRLRGVCLREPSAGR